MNQLFADTIGSITVTGNLVRIDFVSMAAAQPADPKEPRRFEMTQRVVVPLEGFLRGMAAQQDIINKMLEAGILKSNAPEPDAKAAKTGKGSK
jgi:hypothetical protein